MIEHRTEDAIASCSVCDCLASWEPVIHVWSGAGKYSAPMKFDVDMQICDAHRMELKVTDFLCEETWDGIVNWAHNSGLPTPDRTTAEIRFKKINYDVMVH